MKKNHPWNREWQRLSLKCEIKEARSWRDAVSINATERQRGMRMDFLNPNRLPSSLTRQLAEMRGE